MKRARFEEGVPADPTENMSPEDKAMWEEMNQEYGDKFKSATDAKAVASEILRQMGGSNRLRAMLGKDLILSAETVAGKPALMMSFPQRKRSLPNHVVIAYDASTDDYDMTFRRIGTGPDGEWGDVLLHDVRGLYADMLPGVFSEKTNLALRLAGKEATVKEKTRKASVDADGILQMLGGSARLIAKMGQILKITKLTDPGLVVDFKPNIAGMPDRLDVRYSPDEEEYTMLLFRHGKQFYKTRMFQPSQVEDDFNYIVGYFRKQALLDRGPKPSQRGWRRAAVMATWSPSFITANEARMMGDGSCRYVRFDDLDLLEKEEAREMWETTPDPYAFIYEHYYYPVSDQGLAVAPRVLAIPEDKIEDAAYMESLGYEKPTQWVPEPEMPESPFEQVLRMAATITSQQGRQAADAPDFRVQVLDSDSRAQEWIGPSSQLLKDNKGDDEVVEALGKLKKTGDEVLVGGGAVGTFILVRM